MFKRTKHQHLWEEVRREPHPPTGRQMRVKGWGGADEIEVAERAIAKARDGWTAVELRCSECGDLATRELIGITINPILVNVIESAVEAEEVPWTPTQLAEALRTVAEERQRNLDRTHEQGAADHTGGSESHRIARLRTAADILEDS